jgi:hypothetical protein
VRKRKNGKTTTTTTTRAKTAKTTTTTTTITKTTKAAKNNNNDDYNSDARPDPTLDGEAPLPLLLEPVHHEGELEGPFAQPLGLALKLLHHVRIQKPDV